MNIERIYKKLGYSYFYSPYNRVNWIIYPRGSGRTTRMLLDAIKRIIEVKSGEIIIVGKNSNAVHYYANSISKYLKKLNYEIIKTNNDKYEAYKKSFFNFFSFAKNGYIKRANSIYFLTLDFFVSDDFMMERVIDWKNVFIDHSCFKEEQINDLKYKKNNINTQQIYAKQIEWSKENNFPIWYGDIDGIRLFVITYNGKNYLINCLFDIDYYKKSISLFDSFQWKTTSIRNDIKEATDFCQEKLEKTLSFFCQEKLEKTLSLFLED